MQNNANQLVGAPTRLGQHAITVAQQTLYTAPAQSRALLMDYMIANTTASPISVTVTLGAAGATGNALMYGVSIPGNTSVQWTGNQILNSADTIKTSATSTGLTITASGVEGI